MSVRMRSTKGRRNKRRSSHGVDMPTYVQEGGHARLRHRVSRITGMYRSKAIIAPSKKIRKSEEKQGKKETEKAISQEATIPQS